jgi:hypothetical protein
LELLNRFSMKMSPSKLLPCIKSNNVLNLAEDALVGRSSLTVNKYTAEYNTCQMG